MGNESSTSKPNSPAKKSSSGIISSLKPGPSSSVVNQHLETAKKTRVLSLKSSNLKTIPNSLSEVTTVIRTLDLSQNKITNLPSFFGNFDILKQLHLNGNLLQELPDEIGNLKKLEVLNLSNNNLSKIPDTIVGCVSLTNLNLSYNNFKQFPTCLCYLPNVDIIDLSHNKITEFPDDIEKISAHELNLNKNKLSTLNQHLSLAKRLKTLRVDSNELPKQAFFRELFEESNVSLIEFDNNLFQHKDFQDLQGYEKYEERFTANRRKAAY